MIHANQKDGSIYCSSDPILDLGYLPMFEGFLWNIDILVFWKINLLSV